MAGIKLLQNLKMLFESLVMMKTVYSKDQFMLCKFMMDEHRLLFTHAHYKTS